MGLLYAFKTIRQNVRKSFTHSNPTKKPVYVEPQLNTHTSFIVGTYRFGSRYYSVDITDNTCVSNEHQVQNRNIHESKHAYIDRIT